jgi:phosphatidylinositol 3-kinase
MRFKYKDLTTDSYINLELYSMQLPEDKALLGTTKIFLFDENLNLYQGRHIFKLNKNGNENEIENNDININGKNGNIFIKNEEKLDSIGKEIDLLVNTFFEKEFKNTSNYYGNKEGISITNSMNNKHIFNNYYFNYEKNIPELKTEYMSNYDNKLSDLLNQTENAYVVIKFPSFKNAVIYEEDISDDYHKVFKCSIPRKENINKYTSWIYDPSINISKKDNDFLKRDNPISEKFSILARGNDDLFSRDMRLSPVDRNRINELLNTPDFIKLENKDITLFWSYRYELLRNNNDKNNEFPYALTKIMNSVKWGDSKSENEFLKNILSQWKNVEIYDILYMLSRKFSVNKLYPNNDEGIITNLNGMKNLRKIAVKKLAEHTNEELNFILLQLVQAIRYEDISLKDYNTDLVKFLIERCCKDKILASSFFWFISCEADSSDQNIKNKKKEKNEIIEIFDLIKKKFIEELTKYPEIKKIIDNEIEFKEELVKISAKLSHVSKVENKKKELKRLIDGDEKYMMQETEHYLPIDPKLKIKGTISQECSVFKSAKCPVKYTFEVTEDTKKNNSLEDKNHFRIMFKYGDDLRQDQLILQIINYMDSLLKKVHLDYEFTTYKVLATSKSDGFVEFVPNSTTISDILKKNLNEIKPYFKQLSKGREDVLESMLNSYINSCAGYCVVTYILGIGDRHLENLMIDNKGRLFHIDFGYILGKDPKPYPPPIKLCKEMVDCMGGKNSKKFEEFKQKCVNAYWVLRENAKVIVNMFYLMIDSGIPELNNIEMLNKLNDKFAPGFDKIQAQNSLLSNLEESVDAFFPVLMETIHKWAQYMKN